MTPCPDPRPGLRLGAARVLARQALGPIATRFLRSLGFQFVTLDLQGYRTGSLNEALSA